MPVVKVSELEMTPTLRRKLIPRDQLQIALNVLATIRAEELSKPRNERLNPTVEACDRIEYTIKYYTEGITGKVIEPDPNRQFYFQPNTGLAWHE